jgi:hypothetical protein
MKAFLAAGVLVLLFTAALSAQSKQCNLSFNDVSAIRGLRLGMTSEQVVSLLGDPSVRDKGHIGYTRQLSNTGNSQIAGLVDVDHIDLSLLQDQVSSIFINYKPYNWGSAKEYAAAVSEKLNLPRLWKYRGTEADMVCRDFSLKLDSSMNSLTLQDLSGNVQQPINQKGNGNKKNLNK